MLYGLNKEMLVKYCIYKVQSAWCNVGLQKMIAITNCVFVYIYKCVCVYTYI